MFLGISDMELLGILSIRCEAAGGNSTPRQYHNPVSLPAKQTQTARSNQIILMQLIIIQTCKVVTQKIHKELGVLKTHLDCR